MRLLLTRRRFGGLLAAGVAGLALPGKGRKVIADTDPGIDDAMALLFLHGLRQIDLLGITTTFGVLGNVSPAGEANISGDPTAADEVFGTDWYVTAIGLDVTERIAMPQDYLFSLSHDAGAAGRFIWDITRFYENSCRQAGFPGICAHDAAAVAYLVAPELFKTRQGPIRVVREGLAAGETIQKPEGRAFPKGPWDGRRAQTIGADVDAEGVRDLFRRSLADAARR